MKLSKAIICAASVAMMLVAATFPASAKKSKAPAMAAPISYSYKPVSTLEVTSGIEAVYTIDSLATQTKVTITTTEKMKPFLQVSNSGSKLVLSLKNQHPSVKKNEVKVTITGPWISSLTTTSGAEFNAQQLPSRKDLHINATSGSEINIGSIYAPKVVINATSGAEIDIKNIATPGDLNVNVNSGGDCDMKKTIARNINALSTSGAGIDLDDLNAGLVVLEASSGAYLKAAGWAINVKETKSSGGSIRNRIQLKN